MQINQPAKQIVGRQTLDTQYLSTDGAIYVRIVLVENDPGVYRLEGEIK